MIYKNCTMERFFDECQGNIIVFGTSNLAMSFMEDAEQYGACDKILFFVDNDSSQWGQSMRWHSKEYVIFSPRELKEKSDKTCIVIASSYVYDIAKQLEEFAELSLCNCYFYPFMKWSPDYCMEGYLQKTERMRHKYEDQKEQFQRIKNSHLGERCFIIGNGPSLKPKDLDLLQGEYCFGANQIFFAFKSTQWRPDAYLTVNIDSFLAYREVINDLGCPLKLIDKKCLDYGVEIENAVYLKHGNYAKDDMPFSDDIEKYYYNGGTVTYTAMQVAVYMGFREIYLIGVDNNYAMEKSKDSEKSENNIQNHFYKDSEDEKSANLYSTVDVNHLTQSFVVAKEYAEKNNIQIYNATRGGKLEVFPRRRLEDVLIDRGGEK